MERLSKEDLLLDYKKELIDIITELMECKSIPDAKAQIDPSEYWALAFDEYREFCFQDYDDYEILSFIANGNIYKKGDGIVYSCEPKKPNAGVDDRFFGDHEVYSVKRLFDGVVISVGDLTKYGIIKRIIRGKWVVEYGNQHANGHYPLCQVKVLKPGTEINKEPKPDTMSTLSNEAQEECRNKPTVLKEIIMELLEKHCNGICEDDSEKVDKFIKANSGEKEYEYEVLECFEIRQAPWPSDYSKPKKVKRLSDSTVWEVGHRTAQGVIEKLEEKDGKMIVWVGNPTGIGGLVNHSHYPLSELKPVEVMIPCNLIWSY